MNNQKLLKIAGVLLLSAMMLFSASAVMANTKTITTSFKANGQPQGSENTNRDVIWDNGFYTTNALSSQLDLVYPFNSQVADDFELGSGQTVTEIIFWGLFWGGTPINPIDLNVIFYADDGSGNQPTGAGMADPTPTALLVDFHSAVLGVDNGDGSFTYDIVLNTPFTAAAGMKYWVVTQWVGAFPPQWGCCVSDMQQLHACMQGFPLLAVPYWTDPGYGDVAFQLIGGAPVDTTPPVTTCDITGTNPVTVTITATDDMSGVNHTYYQLDAAAVTEYTAPFQVSVPGDHTLMCYSVDKAGNEEVHHYCNFTVEAPTLTITIKGGIGVSATIKNTGTTDLTNIAWTITLDGKLIFVGKTKGDTIASLAAGEEVIVKDFVIGFGKTGIAVEAGATTASATGTVILIFVIGVA
ncbi:MAG: hypothetical protein V1769_02365 [Thermoplasmatota archaeon]